jgi:DNA-binding transcriptional ArsR family regulator
MVNNVIALDRVFGALADPTRRRIVERLSRRSLTIGQIAAEFDISQPAISKHVRVLEESGLLERRIEGRVHHCALSAAAMESASKWIDKQRAYWNASLDRLDEVLAKEAKKRK